MAEIKSLKIKQKISELRKKYHSNKDAQEEIDRAVETALCHEKHGEDDKALNHIQALEDFLHDWY